MTNSNRNHNTKDIIFDAERMRYFNTGLYHYCLHLGGEILKLANLDTNYNISMYSSKRTQIFSGLVKYLNFNRFHKYFLPKIKKGSIWHCNFQLTNYFPKTKGIHRIITVHDLNFIREKDIKGQRKYFKKLGDNLDAADVIVCISNFVRRELEEHFDTKNKRIEVIYNGNNINTTVVASPLIREGLDLSKPFLFTIGVLLPKKNFIVLVNLLVNNDLNLVISGQIESQEYLNEILDLAIKLGVRERVFITGAISESEKYFLLSRCHLFCFPSLTEGFGLPVVEAMHFGCNIIISKSTSLPEIGGDVVKYFESFDYNYLQELSNEIPSWKITDKEKERIKNRSNLFSWETAASKYFEIYKSLI